MSDAQRQLSPIEAAVAQRATAVSILRMVFLVMVAIVILLYTLERRTSSIAPNESNLEVVAGWWLPVIFGTIVAVGAFLIDRLTPRKSISTLSGIALGLIAGLVAAWALGIVVNLLASTYSLYQTDLDPVTKQSTLRLLPAVEAIKVIIGICCVYLTISIVLQTQDDFRLVIPYVEFAKQLRGPKPLLLDTSALIDARIADLAQTGFVQVPLVVPAFVLLELQTLADSADKLKRAKGRRGLEVVTRLQRTPGLDVTVDQTPMPGKAVDQMLVELARQMPATIVTADAGLMRVASIQSVRVLNLNDVANALKPALIVGSSLVITIVKPGEQAGQGVGYLEDGTMIVVSDAGAFIGSELRVEVTSALQTSAGRLIFARPADASAEPAPAQNFDAPTPEAEATTAESASGEAEPESEQAPAQQTLGTPLTVKPPAPNEAKPKPGPFPPQRGRGNPQRNPRR